MPPASRRARPLRPIVVAVAVAVASGVAGCGDDDGGRGGDRAADGAGDSDVVAATTTSEGTDAESAALADVSLTLTEVARAEEPTALVSRPGTDDLYVAERAGRVRTLAPDGSLGPAVLDISDEVVTDFEKGLLDIEFADDGDTLYVSYSVAPDGDTRIVAVDLDGDTVAEGSRRQVLALEQPFGNHNGGDVEIGPDGHLYVGLGDGGSGGDPMGNGQDPSTLLGTILRIDPAGPGGDGYTVPADNPFVDDPGAGAPEVWLYGVRNPWRLTFDDATGDLWVADVGQSDYEEVDLLPAADGAGAGANLGWNEMEGTHPFEGGTNPAGAVLPVLDYGRDQGCSVIGGVVYHGAAIPRLDGAYLFTDYCAGAIRALRAEGGEIVDQHIYDLSLTAPISFGTDADGEAYVLAQAGGIYRLDPG